MKTSLLEMGNLIQGLKLSCQTENKSPKTVVWYTCFPDKFHQFLKRNNYPTGVKRVNRNHIRAFILFLLQEAKTPHAERPLSQSTVQGYVRTLKSFFGWLKREEYLEHNLMTGIPVPRTTVKIINTFNQEHITSLINHCIELLCNRSVFNLATIL